MGMREVKHHNIADICDEWSAKPMYYIRHIQEQYNRSNNIFQNKRDEYGRFNKFFDERIKYSCEHHQVQRQ